MKWESYSHPISDIRDWDKNNRLELQPDFQRNVVWSKAAQIMLIDTILKDIPIPKIYIKSIMKEENTYRIVIDGQQRLTSILMFVNDKLPLDPPYEGEYHGLFFSQLDDTVKNRILRYKIDINEIFNPTDEEIRDLYSRVNKYTIQLNKQELRKADFPGDFIKLAEKISELEFFGAARIFSAIQRRRMYDVEYIEELLTIILEGVQDKKDYLDNVCEKYIHMDNKSDVYNCFKDIINDIMIIFNPEIMPIRNTRFKQKSDFYSLFACIYELKKNKAIDTDSLTSVREKLLEMDQLVGPQSENDDYREYATRCLSDANSISSRTWRIGFISKILNECYK